MTPFRAITIAFVLALVPFTGAVGHPGHHKRAATARPAAVGWVAEVTNPYFPLHPGTTFHYTGERDGVVSTDDIAG